MQQKIEFYERQTFPTWIKIFISIVELFVLCWILLQRNNIELLVFISLSVLFIGVTLFVWLSTLKTIINDDGIFVKFFPMLKFKLYVWENISNIEVKRQEIVSGNRFSLKFGFRLSVFQGPIKVYNFAGRYYLQFTWKKNCKIRISSNQPVEMEEVLEKLGKINLQADI